MPNLIKKEHKALKELKTDTVIVAVPAEKGRVSVTIDHEGYVNK